MRHRGGLAFVVAAAFVLAAGLLPGTARAADGFDSTRDGLTIVAGNNTGWILVGVTSSAPLLGVGVDPTIDWGDGTRSGLLVRGAPLCTECALFAIHPGGYPGPGDTGATVTYTSLSGTYRYGFGVHILPSAFSIVSVGDSVASGEGNPDVPATGFGTGLLPQNAALWSDGIGTSTSTQSQCHRSVIWAGPAQASGLVGQANGIGVGFHSLACTGNDVPQTVAQVESLPPGHIDALTISAGANSLGGGFDKVVLACLASVGTTCDQANACMDPTQQVHYPDCELFHDRIAADLAALPGQYDQLAEAIANHPGGIGAVYITEYFDPTHDASGDWNAPSDCMPLDQGWAMTPAEWQWEYQEVMVPLNQAVQAAAAAHGWNYVGGIAQQFLDHGFCAWTTGQNWVVAASSGPPYLEALSIQNDDKGTLHPNHAGQAVYANAIANAIDHEQPPHTTITATAVEASGTRVGPLPPGARTQYDVLVEARSVPGLPTAGVKDVYLGIDQPACAPAQLGACQEFPAGGAAVTVTGEGNHVVTAFGSTPAGTFEQPQTFVFSIERPPVTTAAAALPDGASYTFGDWTNQAVAVQLTVAGGGIGTKTYFSLDDAGCDVADASACTRYGGAPIQVAGEGVHELRWFSTQGSLVEALHTATIRIDQTPPTASVSAAQPPNAAGWYDQPVELALSCSDSLSGVAAPTGGLPTTTLSSDGANQTWTASCTDLAGNTASASATVSIDTTPPVATVTDRTPANGAGWNRAPVHVTWSCTDALSGATQSSVDATVSGEGRDQVARATCSDAAGNTTTAQLGGIDIDLTPPSVTGTPDRAPRDTGWYTAPTTVTWQGDDSLSGIASCDAPSTYAGPDSPNATVAGTCVDAAGNVGSAALSFRYDATPPTAALLSRTPPNAFGWNRTPVDVSWSCADLTSGPVQPTVSARLDQEGDGQTATATCADAAGNTTDATLGGIRIDLTPPQATATASRPPDSNGWYNHPLGIAWTGTDALSGIDSCTPAVTYAGPDAGSVSRTGTCSDRAGNTDDATLAFRYDATPPSIVFAGNAGTYGVTDTVEITCTAQDALSGPASAPCSGVDAPAWSFAAGTNTFSASATDVAGNTARASGTFALTVTADGLCRLTTSFAESSAAYQALPARLRSGVDGLANAVCNHLTRLAGANAHAKHGLLVAYDAAVTALARGGWLTADQEATLKRLAPAV